MYDTVLTPENFKDKAKIIRSFMKEKCDADISHSHGLELISQLFGYKDWNTASAAVKSEVNKKSLRKRIKNVGQMRKALEPFECLWGQDSTEQYIKVRDLGTLETQKAMDAKLNGVLEISGTFGHSKASENV